MTLEGTGSEVVVLLHGTLNTASTWDATVAAFGSRFKILRYTRTALASLEEQQTELLALLEQAGIKQFHLLGHSGGGVLAFTFAGLHPERILSLTLVDSLARVDAAFTTKINSVLAALAAGHSSLAYTVAVPWLFGADFLGQQAERLTAMHAKAALQPAEDLRGQLEYVLAFGDQRKFLRALESPVLVVVGSDDVLTPMRYSHEIVEWVKPGLGVLVTITGAGHNAPLEKPAEFNRIVMGFLERAKDFTKPLWDDLEEEDETAGDYHNYDELLDGHGV